MAKSRLSRGGKEEAHEQGLGSRLWLRCDTRAHTCESKPSSRGPRIETLILAFGRNALMSAFGTKRTSLLVTRLSPTGSGNDLAASLYTGLRSASANSKAGKWSAGF